MHVIWLASYVICNSGFTHKVTHSLITTIPGHTYMMHRRCNNAAVPDHIICRLRNSGARIFNLQVSPKSGIVAALQASADRPHVPQHVSRACVFLCLLPPTTDLKITEPGDGNGNPSGNLPGHPRESIPNSLICLCSVSPLKCIPFLAWLSSCLP